MLDKVEFRPLRLFGLAIAASCVLAATAQAGPYLVVDYASGRVIAESDAGVPWHPASVTKLMTTYLAFQAMRERRVEPLTLLKVSENAVAQPPSKMGFKAGTEVTLDNAIKMLMVRSANDIAVVIAEGLAGSVQSFAHQMNATAGRLGMSGTRFVNPHGLPEELQVTTARDMAILARALIRDFPEYEFYFRIPAIQIGKRVIRNHNRLIGRYPGADGMKTGFICSSGFNVVAGAQRNGRKLIAVVFGAYSSSQRAEDAATLFERGFRSDLMPNEIGTLEQIKNVHAAPHDMRDEMCNPKRRRPTAVSSIGEDEEDEESAEVKDDSKSKRGEKEKKRASLLGDRQDSMPPIRVFTGLPSSTPEDGIIATHDAPKQAEKKKAPVKTETAKVEPAKNDAKKVETKKAETKKTDAPKTVQAGAASKPSAQPVSAKPKEAAKQPKQ
ncbi:MAG TPA: serine hydrolase [Xanthobacteraceae bacterium]|nr:serine hydrolase [Xanthobacteraceae bacterium]